MNLHRVLVVDDDSDILALVENVLGESCEVLCSTNARMALESLDIVEPDFFIIDVMMPLMDGREMVRRIRKIPLYAVAPVFFLSVLNDRNVIMDSYSSGGDLYLTKPFIPDRFINSILAFIAKKALPVRKKRYTAEAAREMLKRGKESEKHKSVRTPKPKTEFPFASDSKPETAETPPPVTTPPQASEPVKPPAPPKPVEKAPKTTATTKPVQPVETQTEPPADVGPEPLSRKKVNTLPRVLIADDDEDLLEYLTLSLGDKYEMFTAIDGLEVVKFADTLEPDIFILDAMMPRMTGYQVCQVLKKSERFANVPIIIISAKASRNDVEYVKRLGVRAFIPKPFDFMQLDNAIVRIVRDHYFEIKPKQHTYEEILKIREDQVAKNAEKDKDRKHRETRSILKDFLSQNPDAQ